ncbi:hypothetical protein BY996DRAFT_7191036 [Phakopsora pachyrhizi]|nr:hypothetical protein BY996DRAFT_7191036 [Phakopsora pachyrhizi]
MPHSVSKMNLPFIILFFPGSFFFTLVLAKFPTLVALSEMPHSFALTFEEFIAYLLALEAEFSSKERLVNSG